MLQEKFDIRIGNGYDVHKFKKGRKLILGGVEIPYEAGLDGHSDADVLVHALMDAMLGALALGDIGKHFPPSDPAFKDISSLKLLAHVNKLISERGYRLHNADLIIAAQKPRLAEYRNKMAENIASVLEVPAGDISVKATTEEGLGFTGELKGIKAYAVCLLEKYN